MLSQGRTTRIERDKMASSTARQVKRPTSVKVICYFYWLNTLVFGAVGVIGILLMAGPYLTGALPLSRMWRATPDILLAGGLSIVIAAAAVFFAAVGWKLWQLKCWARSAAIAGSGLVIIFSLVLTVIRLISGELGMSYALVFHGWALGALFRRDVKAAFGLTPSPSLVTQPEVSAELVTATSQSEASRAERSCHQCGTSLRDGALFCHNCGARRQVLSSNQHRREPGRGNRQGAA
jgi:hypothetical protein